MEYELHVKILAWEELAGYFYELIDSENIVEDILNRSCIKSSG